MVADDSCGTFSSNVQLQPQPAHLWLSASTNVLLSCAYERLPIWDCNPIREVAF